jgi:pimeloyl-ACP methyl ester carboxylesterase
MPFELIKEGKFEYVEQGNGEPVLLLHGLFGALSNFKEVIEKFSADYKVIIPILPIYKLSLINTNVKEIAKYVREFIKYKDLKDITLVGNSLGGHVGLILTVNHQDLIKRLVLTGSSGLYENTMGGSFPRREDYNFIKDKVGQTFYDPNTASKELVDEVFEIVNDKGRLIRILAIAKSAIRHNMAKELDKIKVPVCLIWGKNDTVTPPEVAEEFHKLISQSQLYWIDKCGHAAMMEQPTEFNEILFKWIKSN